MDDKCKMRCELLKRLGYKPLFESHPEIMILRVDGKWVIANALTRETVNIE